MRISKDPQTRRQEILCAARELFLSQGYENTSVEDIMKQVNVAKGLFYYYFPKKEAILSSIADEFAEGVNKAFAEHQSADTTNFREGISYLLAFYLDIIGKNENLLNITTSSGTVVSLHLRQKLEDNAIAELKRLLTADPQRARLSYPEYTAKILVRGLADLYLEGVTDPAVLTTLIEETLGLVQGSLSGGAKPPLRRKAAED